MTNKERKTLKHSLKTDIDHAEAWILLALTGEKLEAQKYPEKDETRELIINRLRNCKATIQEKTEKYLKAIDEAIEKIS